MVSAAGLASSQAGAVRSGEVCGIIVVAGARTHAKVARLVVERSSSVADAFRNTQDDVQHCTSLLQPARGRGALRFARRAAMGAAFLVRLRPRTLEKVICIPTPILHPQPGPTVASDHRDESYCACPTAAVSPLVNLGRPGPACPAFHLDRELVQPRPRPFFSLLTPGQLLPRCLPCLNLKVPFTRLPCCTTKELRGDACISSHGKFKVSRPKSAFTVASRETAIHRPAIEPTQTDELQVRICAQL